MFDEMFHSISVLMKTETLAKGEEYAKHLLAALNMTTAEESLHIGVLTIFTAQISWAWYKFATQKNCQTAMDMHSRGIKHFLRHIPSMTMLSMPQTLPFNVQQCHSLPICSDSLFAICFCFQMMQMNINMKQTMQSLPTYLCIIRKVQFMIKK